MRESKRRQGRIIPPLVVSSALVVGPAFATSDGPDRFAVRDVRPNDTLALRAQPNASARKITGLPPQSRGLENLGCVHGKTGQAPADTGPAGNQLWCKVRIGSLVGWASARFLREDAEPLKPYSVSGAPTGPEQFTATSTVIEKREAGDGRWRVVTQTVISNSTSADILNEVTLTTQLVDCRRGRSEVIRLDGIAPGTVTIEDRQGPGFQPALSDFNEYNLWSLAYQSVFQRYRWP